MKLADHVEHIRQLIDTAFRNRLGRMGFVNYELQISNDYIANEEQKNIESIQKVLIEETGSKKEAYEKLVEEFTFTLFNRLAALKVMEAHTLHPEIVTRRSQHGDRSFAHKHWLEQHPDGRSEEMEGLVHFIQDQLAELAADIPLFSPQHPYHLLPTAIELNGILKAFNDVDSDPDVNRNSQFVIDTIWQSDDVLGWLYESYNNYKKAAHKESGDKTEFNKVSIQSQVYTPRWVVKFLVDNSLGKLYLEMYPDSDIKNRYKIANAPAKRTRTPKPLTEIKLIDPATGSGNYLLYGFDLFYDLYTDQIENYGADYDDRKISELIIAHNLYGVDLDDRAIQLAQLGLYIKAKRKKLTAKIDHFNIVSSDFFLPAYAEVKHLFESEQLLSPELEKIVTDLWADLQQAYKFGALIRLEEKFSMRLHGLVQKEEGTLFAASNLANYEQFRENFFTNLQKAVTQNTAKQGQTFLNTKTQDAITFLQLLTQKYDLAVANPPYTDSADFGPELKRFIDANYKQPFKFNSNLYAAFIKRSYELINEKGKMALIHPLTFMYIKTFEDVRKFILDKLHINVFVDYGLSSLFGSITVDPAFYVLEKEKSTTDSWFISLDQNSRTTLEKFKKDHCIEALNDFIESRANANNYVINQNKLKIIDGWPFIYWISDAFRELFNGDTVGNIANVVEGCNTANNERFLRFWWEIDINQIDLKWFRYTKGGPYNKWYGNLWLTVNWLDDGFEIKNFTDENGKVRSRPQNEGFYKKEGITFTGAGSKGVSFRYLPRGCIFDTGSRSIFPKNSRKVHYLLGLLNSSISLYIADSLNPTVNTTVGDIKRIPFVETDIETETTIAFLASSNIEIKKELCSYRIFEPNFEKKLLLSNTKFPLKEKILSYLSYENFQTTILLLNESIINLLVYKIYNLSKNDRERVENKMGKQVAEFPVLDTARNAYLAELKIQHDIVKKHIESLDILTIEEVHIQSIISEFGALYKSGNNLEEFCIRNKVNPINVWYWFNENKTIPQGRAFEITLEFLTDAIRTILLEDNDCIIPLVGLPGEPKLLDRLEQYCFNVGLSSAQFMQLDNLLGRPIDQYLDFYFFNDLCDHFNLFNNLPKTPFIWHLSSGEHQGFEAYIIIYKWNRDSLYKLKSHYLSKRTESLHYRLHQIGDSTSAQAQTEKETIRLQLQEIEGFTKKIDELIAEGYDPKLDDGVGKNIAPLQKKGMLRAEVLNKKQLEKYLNADW